MAQCDAAQVRQRDARGGGQRPARSTAGGGRGSPPFLLCHWARQPCGCVGGGRGRAKRERLSLRTGILLVLGMEERTIDAPLRGIEQ